MPETRIFEGKTTNEAIEKGLKELKVSKSDEEINKYTDLTLVHAFDGQTFIKIFRLWARKMDEWLSGLKCRSMQTDQNSYT